jgi:hypothetical protein
MILYIIGLLGMAIDCQTKCIYYAQNIKLAELNFYTIFLLLRNAERVFLLNFMGRGECFLG